jgi:hypothetical protein
MLTTVGISTSTRSAKLVGASRAATGATMTGWTSSNAKAAPAVTAARLENPVKTREHHVRPPTALKARSRPTINLAGAAVRVPVYMAADCGANKEAVMLPDISAF